MREGDGESATCIMYFTSYIPWISVLKCTTHQVCFGPGLWTHTEDDLIYWEVIEWEWEWEREAIAAEAYVSYMSANIYGWIGELKWQAHPQTGLVWARTGAYNYVCCTVYWHVAYYLLYDLPTQSSNFVPRKHLAFWPEDQCTCLTVLYLQGPSRLKPHLQINYASLCTQFGWYIELTIELDIHRANIGKGQIAERHVGKCKAWSHQDIVIYIIVHRCMH